jgi:hypothetical protein
MDQQFQRARGQTRQATLSRVRVLADLPDPGPMGRNASYLTSARNHGVTVLDAITTALAGRPWLSAIPA